MTSEVLIRPAQPSDIDAIADLSRSLANHVQDPDSGLSTETLIASGFRADPWFECHVALIEESIVGFVLFCRRFEAHTRQRSLWIGDLITSKQARWRGVGIALIEAVRRRAKELAADTIAFEVWHENRSALEFYEHLGAKIVRDRHLLLIEAAPERFGANPEGPIQSSQTSVPKGLSESDSTSIPRPASWSSEPPR